MVIVVKSMIFVGEARKEEDPSEISGKATFHGASRGQRTAG
jgi:hypothetical protein